MPSRPGTNSEKRGATDDHSTHLPGRDGHRRGASHRPRRSGREVARRRAEAAGDAACGDSLAGAPPLDFLAGMSELGFRRDIPNLDFTLFPILTRPRNESLAVRAESHADYRKSVAGETAPRLPCCQVPDCNHLVSGDSE